jgi:V/A-type H+-transporting ATPase subunit D
MELLRLRRHLALARKGHKLLKDKQDELVRRFFALFDGYLAARERLHRSLERLAGLALQARVEAPAEEIRAAAWPQRSCARVVAGSDAILNLRVPRYELVQPAWEPAYSPHQLSAAYDHLALGWQRAVPLLVAVAQQEKALRLLAGELSTLRRRVNALEYTLIPGLEGGVRSISLGLAEQERSALTRLMRVKELVRGH